MTAIVTLGAVAGAVSTIVSLWPSPDADDSAEVTVRIIPGIPLSEYQHRVASSGTISLKGYSPPGDETTSEPTGSAESTETTSPERADLTDPTEIPDPSSSVLRPTAEPTVAPATAPPSTFKTSPPSKQNGDASPTETADPSPDVALIEDNSINAQYARELEDSYVNLTGDTSVPTEFLAIGNAIAPSGEPVDPAVAAERIARVLSDARHTPARPTAEPAVTAPEPEPTGEPLGVVVSTDLDLSGLRGVPLTLSWSMWQEGGDVRLSGDWLNDNLAYRIEPRTDHATTTLDVWIPMPREPGSYFVRVDLRHGPTRIDSGESERFE